MLSSYKQHVQDKLAERLVFKNQLIDFTKQIEQAKDLNENQIKARHIIADVAKLTQTKFTSYVEQLVTLAIKSIFDRPFKFKVDFDLKRNKSECFLRIQEGEDEEPFVPSQELGGGVLDIISFSLRIVLWSLQNPRSCNTILLDEPFHFLGKLSDRAGTLVNELSRRMNLQFIIVTHDEVLTNIADAAWKVVHNGTHSVVTQIVGETKSRLLRGR